MPFIDPRPLVIPKRLSVFKHAILVLSPKGGVGKTTIAVALSAMLGNENIRTSLLDLDINNPTAHIILGIDAATTKVDEDRGILPIKLLNGYLEFMSIAFFTRDRLLPLRGKEISSAVIEILSTVRWANDILVVDTPPGFSDEVMEFLKFYPKAKVLTISTIDKMSITSAKRAIKLLGEEKIEVLGVIGNMCRDLNDIDILRGELDSLGIDVIACIPWLEDLQKTYGQIENIAKMFKPYLMPIAHRLQN